MTDQDEKNLSNDSQEGLLGKSSGKLPVESKEEFCGACLAVPLAFVGAGASAYGSGKGSHRRQRKMIFWVGIVSVLLSLAVAYYYMYVKDCSECR